MYMIRRQTTSTLFPYTSLFRSRPVLAHHRRAHLHRSRHAVRRLAHRAHDGVARHAAAADRWVLRGDRRRDRSEEHTSELQSRLHIVCRLLLEIKNFMRQIKKER